MLRLFRTVVPRVSGITIPVAARLVPVTSIRAFSHTPLSFNGWEEERGRRGNRDDYGRPYQPFKQQYGSSTSIWVGNLPYSASAERLKEVFSAFGTVTNVRLGMTQDGVSKGFAHIDFATLPESEAVVEASSKEQFFIDGRLLRIDFAGPVKALTPRPPSNILHIGNYSGNEAQLAVALSDYQDRIRDIRLVQSNGRSFGFITLGSIADAEAVKEEWDGKEIVPQEPIKLGFASERRNDRPDGRDRGDRGGRDGGYSQGYRN
ncbi:hypothetical protein BU17DRAFT_88371 [Hysterangium stoloniferum]|nr:hypothetical protein BU17DRAFT_88371 [Hysterangium stoloniferum]